MIEHVKVPEITKVVAEETTPPRGKLTLLADKFFGIFNLYRVEKEPEPQKKRINKRDWKEWEIAFMKEEYPAMSVKDIAIHLKRPYGTVYDNMRKRGIIKKKD